MAAWIVLGLVMLGAQQNPPAQNRKANPQHQMPSTERTSPLGTIEEGDEAETPDLKPPPKEDNASSIEEIQS